MPFNNLHKEIWKECSVCKKSFIDKQHRPNRKYCSKKCYIKSVVKKNKINQKLNEELGMCKICGGERENIKYKLCIECRIKHRKYYKRKK